MEILNKNFIEISEPIYNQKIVIYVGQIEQFKEFLKTNYNYEPHIDDAVSGAAFKYSEKNLHFIWFSTFNISPESFDLLTHEAVHVALNVLHYHNVHICNNGQEPLAYYVGFIVREATKFLFTNA